jgi:GntR family transcriptional regulator/MocR family aminotransferase
MPLSRRLELLECADRTGALIVEDDYDSEFQFAGRPVAALQGLDQSGRVIYVGTFSKILQPGIRVGYIVAPPELAGDLARIQRNTGQLVPVAVQSALADFISEGHMRAHVRRMCALYEQRQQALLAALDRHFGDRVSVEVPAGGMQLIADFGPGFDDVGASERLAEAGVAARPVSRFYLGDAQRRGFLMGFAGYSEAAIGRAMEKTAAVLKS